MFTILLRITTDKILKNIERCRGKYLSGLGTYLSGLGTMYLVTIEKIKTDIQLLSLSKQDHPYHS